MTLANVLRRYIYYIEEKDIEYDIQREENINQFYMMNNYSSKMSEVLQLVSIIIDSSHPIKTQITLNRIKLN